MRQWTASCPGIGIEHGLHRMALPNGCSCPYAPKASSPGSCCVGEVFRNLMETVGMSDSKARNRQAIRLARGPAGRAVELATMNDVW